MKSIKKYDAPEIITYSRIEEFVLSLEHTYFIDGFTDVDTIKIRSAKPFAWMLDENAQKEDVEIIIELSQGIIEEYKKRQKVRIAEMENKEEGEE